MLNFSVSYNEILHYMIRCMAYGWVRNVRTELLKGKFFLKNFFFGLDGRIWQKSMLHETKIFFVKSVDFLFTLFENVLNA